VRASAAVGLAALAVAPATARADRDDGEPMRRITLEVVGGLRGGDGDLVLDGRATFAVVVARGAPHRQPRSDRSWFAAIGLHGALGSVIVDDERAIDGEIATRRSAWGPEARIGVGWMDDGLRSYVFASGGMIRTSARAITRELPEDGEHTGARAAIGLAFPGSYRAALNRDCSAADDRSSCELFEAFGIFLPNTFEVTYERVAGASRGGVGIGYAF
jgi:hypothetical protein